MFLTLLTREPRLFEPVGQKLLVLRVPWESRLVGATTLLDSLQAARRGGIVCMTGILGGKWVLSDFRPMGDVPTGVKLTSYSGESSDITSAQLQKYVSLVESGELALKLGPSFPFERLHDAHTLMDENRANGKIVMEVA